MEHLHYPLSLNRGDVVEVDLDHQANIRLMDGPNYSRYCSGGRYSFYGGRAVRSPATVVVPRSGRWHLAIDLGGAAGRIRASVRTRSLRA